MPQPIKRKGQGDRARDKRDEVPKPKKLSPQEQEVRPPARVLEPLALTALTCVVACLSGSGGEGARGAVREVVFSHHPLRDAGQHGVGHADLGR